MSPEDPPQKPSDPSPHTLAEDEAEIARIDEQLAEIKTHFAPGEKLHGPLLKRHQSLSMKKAGIRRRHVRQVKSKTGLRLVHAVQAERVAQRAIDEAAGMIADTTRILRNAVNRFGDIARKDLADWYVKRLQHPDEKKQEEAARALKEIFERVVEAQGVMNAKKAGRRVVPGWPSEGAKA